MITPRYWQGTPAAPVNPFLSKTALSVVQAGVPGVGTCRQKASMRLNTSNRPRFQCSSAAHQSPGTFTSEDLLIAVLLKGLVLLPAYSPGHYRECPVPGSRGSEADSYGISTWRQPCPWGQEVVSSGLFLLFFLLSLSCPVGEESGVV